MRWLVGVSSTLADYNNNRSDRKSYFCFEGECLDEHARISTVVSCMLISVCKQGQMYVAHQLNKTFPFC